jgi:hypothetical protein
MQRHCFRQCAVVIMTLPSIPRQPWLHLFACCCNCRQVPATLGRNLISKVRETAISTLNQRAALKAISTDYALISSTNLVSGFLHPVGLVGPAEIAALRFRLANTGTFNSPQPGAFAVLLSGEGVPPKNYPGGWAPPTNCPVEGYPGPLAMSKVEIKYGGKEANAANCPASYPAATPAPPKDSCGHISFVEMDGQVRLNTGCSQSAKAQVMVCLRCMRIERVHGDVQAPEAAAAHLCLFGVGSFLQTEDG